MWLFKKSLQQRFPSAVTDKWRRNRLNPQRWVCLYYHETCKLYAPNFHCLQPRHHLCYDCVLGDNVMNIVWTRDYIYGSRFFCLPGAPPILSATLLVHAYTCIYSTVLQFLDEDTWIALAESRVWLVVEPRASAQHTRFWGVWQEAWPHFPRAYYSPPTLNLLPTPMQYVLHPLYSLSRRLVVHILSIM